MVCGRRLTEIQSRLIYQTAPIPQRAGRRWIVERRVIVSHVLVKEYFDLFVNRRAYTLQSLRPHSESSRHYYYRPTERGSGTALQLNHATLSQHLEGKITIGL